MTQSLPLGEQAWPGQRLGLPERGPGSVAGWGRRIVALFVDWFASWAVAMLFFARPLSDDRASLIDLLAVPSIAVAQTTVFVALLGGSFGQLALRIAVARLDGRRVTPAQALVRSVLVYLLIPPLVFNRDHRGLHDLAVGTITLVR